MPKASHVLRRLHSRSSALLRERSDSRFESRIRPGEGPALVLSPHLDDAVLDCWSVLTAQPAPSVVNVFAGTPPAGTEVPLWDRVTGASDPAARMAERLAEDARALGAAGIEPLQLPFLDAQYRRPGNSPQPGDLDRELAARVAASGERVLAPAGIGGHPDHLLVRRYARLLARSGFAVTLYADLPYCALHGWPGWVDGRAEDPLRDVDAFWRSFFGEVPELGDLRSARVARLDDGAAAAKLEAIRCYGTQWPALSYGGRGLLEDPEIHRYEVFWDLPRRAARGG
jgi:LmbE family N-acetylglucosaminyl deacetylase